MDDIAVLDEATAGETVDDASGTTTAKEGEPSIQAEPAGSTPAEPENWVELVGPVMLQRRRGTEAVALEGRSASRTATTQLFVQVNEEHGESYGLRLVFPARSAADAQLVESLREGDRIRVRGRLAWRASYDARYRTSDDDPGRKRYELEITVLELQHATADDPDGSWVQLRGTIADPPQIRQHEVASSLQVARVSLKVQMRQPVTRRGITCDYVTEDRVQLDVPLALGNAHAALAKGNTLAVGGWLELYRQRLDPAREPVAAAAVRQAEEAWQRESAGLQGRALAEAERRHQRRLRGLVYEERLRVRVGAVELIAGRIVDDIDEAIDTWRSWSDERRRQRAARREQRMGSAGNTDAA